MNLEIANRLVEYRKRAGYSQEELADKLGISRQAVSKWERVEASPDTDNLIALANLYGVSLDELINGKKDPDPKVNDQPKSETVEPEQEVAKDEIHIGGGKGVQINSEDGSYVHIDNDGIHTCSKNGEKHHFTEKDLENKLKDHCRPPVAIAYSICSVISVVLFIVFGLLNLRMPTFNFTDGFYLTAPMTGFRWSWIFFVAIPIIPSFIHAILKGKITVFNFAVFVTTIFLYCGMTANTWHPMWVVFLLVPVFYTCFGPIDHYSTRRKAEKLGVDPRELDKDYDPSEYGGKDEDDDD